MLRDVDRMNVECGVILQREATREVGTRLPHREVAEVAMREVDTGGPAPAAAFDGVDLGAGLRPSHPEVAARESRPEKCLAQIPRFVAAVEVERVSPLGIEAQRARESGVSAAFLRVPAQERDEVRRALLQVVELRINRLIGQAAKKRHQRLRLARSPAVAFDGAKRQVKGVVLARRELEVVAREDVEIVEARLSSAQVVEPEDARGSEGKGVVEQHGIDARPRVKLDVLDARLADGIPMLERRLEIAFEQINGGEEVVSIIVARVEAQRLVKFGLGGAKVLLLV